MRRSSHISPHFPLKSDRVNIRGPRLYQEALAPSKVRKEELMDFRKVLLGHVCVVLVIFPHVFPLNLTE